MSRFAVAWILRQLGVFDRVPELEWRGRFRHPLNPWRWVNHSGGRITSTTDRVGPVSRNNRTRRVSVDLPGPLRWVSRRERN